MSSQDVIDALFDRTVDIVQSLPKSGPIQTSYDEKLALYSLYKQAVEGDVNSKRPGMLDMLGRAKWDAWSLRKGMGEFEAKQLYVESMMRILRKFGDRREARQLIQELEAFSGDVAEQVMRGEGEHLVFKAVASILKVTMSLPFLPPIYRRLGDGRHRFRDVFCPSPSTTSATTTCQASVTARL